LAIGFSAFTILIYYAVTNASTLNLPIEKRLWPRWIAILGFASCVILAASLPSQSLLLGAAIMAIGTVIYFINHKILLSAL
jgi:basic amino acid/polyamine antiporter, APA family